MLDGSDNFPTKYLVNDACELLGIPNVYGAILGFEGQMSVFSYQVTLETTNRVRANVYRGR